MVQSKFEWLRERQKGIGGSDVGAIMGVNKWKSPFQIFIDKTTEITEENGQSEAAYWGTELEDMVAREFAKRTGKKVRRDTRHFISKKYPFMVANIDRKVVGENTILECKTVNQYGASDWDGDEIPPSYLLQVQHYLYVTKSQKGYIAVLIGGQKFIWKEIQRDEELINIMIKAESDFWNLVENRIPPELDGSSAAEQYVNEKFNRSNGMTTELTADYVGKVKKLVELKENQKQIGSAIKELENNIKNTMGEFEEANSKEYKVTWKQVISNRVDSKTLKEKYPNIYKDVCKETISRRFLIKESEEK